MGKRAKIRVAIALASTGLLLGGCRGEDFKLTSSPREIVIAQGGTATVTVSVKREGGFKGQVDLTVEGLRSGVTGRFEPAAVTDSTSTLTVSVGPDAPTGTHKLNVRGTSTRLVRTITLTLSVTARPRRFGLTASPNSISIQQGARGSLTIRVDRFAGFSGPVDLTLENAPIGVVGSVVPPSASEGAATLTLVVGYAVKPGSYVLNVRGRSGDMEETTPVTLVVTEGANYELSVSQRSLSIRQGASGTVALTITRSGALTDPVTLTLTGAPSGVTAVFDPNPATGSTSTLTLTVGTAVTPGTYRLTVRGQGGTLIRAAVVELTVTKRQ